MTEPQNQPMNLMESDDRPLSGAEKQRLAMLAFRLGLDGEFCQPGSFSRMHLARLRRQLESAQRRNERERQARAKRPSRTLSEEQRRIQAAAAQAVTMVLEKGISQAKAARLAGIARNTLWRALTKRKAREGNQQPT